MHIPAKLGISLGILLAVMTSQKLVAQTPENQAQEATGGLQEIVVTAQKRSENLQDVPVSVSVINSSQLDTLQVTEVSDLAHISPSLNYQTESAFAANANFSLRGIGAYAPQPGFQPAIGLVVDDVPLARQGEFDSGLSDIANVQILTGPQGTLFGTSTTGGVVIVSTKQPTKSFEGYAEASATTDSQYVERIALSGPLTDEVSARLTVYNKDAHRYLTNLYPGLPDFGGDKETGGRLQFNIDFTDTINLKLSADHTKAASNPVDKIVLADTPQILAVMGNGNPVLGQQIINNNTLTNSNGIDTQNTEDWGTSAVLSWDLTHGFSLKSISSYRDYSLETYQIGPTTPATTADPMGLPYAFGYRSNVGLNSITGPDYTNTVRYFTEEARLAYTSSAIDWLAGIFYNHNDEVLFGESPLLLAPAYDFYDTPREGALQFRSEAVFADATWHVTDAVDIFGGARETHESVGNNYLRNTYATADFTQYNGFILLAPGVQPIDVEKFNLTYTDNEWSGRFGAKWKITPNINVYASASRGFTGASANTSEVADPEHSFLAPSIETSYEVGLKSIFFDRRLILNTALFSAKVVNLQADHQVPTANGVIEQEYDVGALKTKGWEQSITALLGDHLVLAGSLSLLDTELTGGVLQPCYRGQTFAQGCSIDVATNPEQDVDGKQGIDAPHVKYNLNGRYNLPVASMPFNAFATTSYTWQSSTQYSLIYDPIATVEPSYGLLDVAAGIISKNDRYEVTLFGKNVFNQLFAVDRSAPGAGFGREQAYFTRDAFAYWGVKARVSF